MSKKEYPKVLVVSHNPFDLNISIGKTFTSIFSGWPKDSIAQLYFHNQTPDFSTCNNFFHITEEQLILNNKKDVGKIVSENSDIELETNDSSVRNHVKKMELFSLARSILWGFKKWNNSNLYQWVEEFSPEVIFFAAGGSSFSYEIASEISQKYSIPIYLYYMDDFILPRKTLNIFWWVNWLVLRKSVRTILPKVEKVFTIGEDMSLEYEKRLNKECISIMNSINIEEFTKIPNNQSFKDDSNIKIAYFGGLHLNRWKTLSKLGKVIKKMSIEEGVNFNLFIYTNEAPVGKILESLSQSPYIQYVGSVSNKEIISEMKKYDVLVHIESFENKYIQKTKLSISTKIPEYLATGKPILAIGPKNISSIRYIEDTKVNYVVDKFKESLIEERLLSLKNDRKNYKNIGEININIAKRYHSSELNRNVVKETLFRKKV